MTRGDQRERDRARSQAKLMQKKKQTSKGGDPLNRNLSDKQALEAKIQAKMAMKSEEANKVTNQGGPVKRKPKNESNPSLDVLLDAGLPGVKKKTGN